MSLPSTAHKNSFRSARAALATFAGAALLACGTQAAKADVIFTEPFSLNNSSWTNNGGAAATWNANGGPLGAGDGYISVLTPTTGSGAVAVRATASAGASGGGFTGSWLSEGVVTFSIDIMQDSGVIQNFGLRFANAAGFPAGFAGNLAVASGTWTHFEVAINSSSLTFPEGGDFDSVFANIGNVQLTLTGASPSTAYTVSVDNATIKSAAVPEPASLSLLGVTGVCGLSMRRRRKS